MKSLIAALMICTLSAGAYAEKGVVSKTTTDANGHKTIVIKDYRAKKQRPLKRNAAAQFREYDLGPSASDPSMQPVDVSYAPPAPQQQPQQQAYAPQERVRTYTSTYAPGPNASMSPGGGGGSFSSTVLPTSPYYGFYGGYGPYYGYGNYGYGNYGYGNRCNSRPYYPAQYPSTYPGFSPGLPSGPPVNLGFPVFNTVSPPIIPGYRR